MPRFNQAVGSNHPGVLLHLSDIKPWALHGGDRYHRSHIGLSVVGIADEQFNHGADHHRDDAIGNILLQKQQVQRRTAPTDAKKCGSQHVVDDLNGECGGIDDHGVRAAGLRDQRHDGAAAPKYNSGAVVSARCRAPPLSSIPCSRFVAAFSSGSRASSRIA